MWSKRPVCWETDEAHCYSVVFTWDLWTWTRLVQPALDDKLVVVGGPAVKLMPELIPDWVTIGEDLPALGRHNPEATRTSTGCSRHCAFCAVPDIEGDLVELDDWSVQPVVIDNNLLACSRAHFDCVIDGLKGLSWCDFNQGLDARLLTSYHAGRLAELSRPVVRLAFDDVADEPSLVRAYLHLRDAGIPKSLIRVYVLIGFRDTPEDALFRLQLVRDLGIKPFPMRYQSLDCVRRNQYIAPGWTPVELDRYMSYWANLRYTEAVPFEDYQHHGTVREEMLLWSVLSR